MTAGQDIASNDGTPPEHVSIDTLRDLGTLFGLSERFPGCTCGLELEVPCPYACLPLTALRRGNVQFVYDIEGRIYIQSGKHSPSTLSMAS